MRVTVRLLTTFVALALIGVSGGIARAEAAEGTPSQTGSTGLYRMATVADVGSGTVRPAFFGEVARSTNLLVLNDVDTRVITRLAAAADFARRAEVFASFSFSYNRDEQPIPDAPTILKTALVPDLSLGAKGVAWRNDIFVVGGELGARVPMSASALPEAISSWVDVLGSAYLWSGQRSSVRAHLSIGYYFDNSQKQLDVNNLTESDIEVLTFEHATGTDRFRIALGLEGACQGQRSPLVRPFVEYHFERERHTPNDRLLSEAFEGDNQQWLTLGLKAGIGPHLTIEAGVDVATVAAGIAFTPPLPPFDLWAGLTVPFQISGRGQR
ncbi:MAG TPA: hypothetical protein VGP07_01130 [Polyangia bacterium]|jgi:hypothetical protein